MDITIIKEPYNEAWNLLKIIRESDSDEAWSRFMEELDIFHTRLSKATTPHEFAYLKYLYMTIMEASEVIAKLREKSGERANDNMEQVQIR